MDEETGAEAAGLAVAAIGADEGGGGECFRRAIGENDVKFNVGRELTDGEEDFYPAQFYGSALACGGERLPEAEVVKAGADGHGAEGLAKADSDLAGLVGGAAAVEKRRAGFLEDDVAALAFEDWVNGVAERLEGLAGEAACAGFVAREAAFVEQQDAAAGMGEIVGCSAAGGAGADDERVELGLVRGGHGQV